MLAVPPWQDKCVPSLFPRKWFSTSFWAFPKSLKIYLDNQVFKKCFILSLVLDNLMEFLFEQTLHLLNQLVSSLHLYNPLPIDHWRFFTKFILYIHFGLNFLMFVLVIELCVDFLLLSFDYMYSLKVSFFLSFFDNVECSLFGLTLYSLFHLFDSLFNSPNSHDLDSVIKVCELISIYNSNQIPKAQNKVIWNLI